MSKRKLSPIVGVQKYCVALSDDGVNWTYKYFKTKKEAKDTCIGQYSNVVIYKIMFDFIERHGTTH